MAVPEKRVPGWVIIAVLIAAGCLAAIPVILLTPTSRIGPPLLLVRATDNITATPATITVPADFGPHCSKYAYNDARGFLAVEADVDLAGTQAVLLNHYVEQERNFATTSGDFDRPFLLSNSSAWTLLSPVDGHVLATFTQDGANVTANGTTYGSGASWTLHVEYDATTPQGPVHVTEDITLVNEGVVQTRIVPIEPCM